MQFCKLTTQNSQNVLDYFQKLNKSKWRQNMKKILILFSLLIPLLYINNNNCFSEISPQNDLVIVLDTSNSMNTSDKDKAILEGIKELTLRLPENTSTYLITYNQEVQVYEAPLSSENIELLDSIKYKGYSNAGQGLKEAVDLLKTGGRILLINDGEIKLNSKSKTEDSNNLFTISAEEAKQKNIIIDTVFINDECDVISRAASLTDGNKYFVGRYNTFQEVLSDVLFQNYGLDPVLLLKKNVSPELQKLDLPVSGLKLGQLKIILESTVPLAELTLDGSDDSSREENSFYQNGTTYLWTFDALNRDTLSFLFKPKETGIINVYGQWSYGGEVTPHTEIDYTDQVIEETGIREATITLSLLDEDKHNLLTQDVFNQMTYDLTLDGQPIASNFDNGVIQFTSSVVEERSHSLVLVINYFNGQMPKVYNHDFKLEAFNYIAPKKFYEEPYFIIGLLSLLLGGGFYIYKKRTTTEFEIISKKGYPFTGKLNIYMTAVADGDDYPPTSYMLYRAFSRSEMSLKEIFDLCELKIGAKALNGISIAPAQDGGIYIYNNSDATVMVKRDIVIKGTVCLCHYGDKIYITFEDKKTEAEIHYKNVKPSEM